jgi:hypothetical protein
MNFIEIIGERFWCFGGKIVRPMNGGIGGNPACSRKGHTMKNDTFPEDPTFCLPSEGKGPRALQKECTDQVHSFCFYAKKSHRMNQAWVFEKIGGDLERAIGTALGTSKN